MDETKTLRRRVVLKGLAASAVYILCWVGSVFIDHYPILESAYNNWLLAYRALPALAIICGSAVIAWKRLEKVSLCFFIVCMLWFAGIVCYAYIAVKIIYISRPYVDLSYMGWFITYHSIIAIIELVLTLPVLAVIQFARKN